MSEKETSEAIASIAGRVLTLTPIELDAVDADSYNSLLEDAKRLAGSALSQREPVGVKQLGESVQELSILHGQQVSVTFKDADDAKALFNELKMRSPALKNGS